MLHVTELAHLAVAADFRRAAFQPEVRSLRGTSHAMAGPRHRLDRPPVDRGTWPTADTKSKLDRRRPRSCRRKLVKLRGVEGLFAPSTTTPVGRTDSPSTRKVRVSATCGRWASMPSSNSRSELFYSAALGPIVVTGHVERCCGRASHFCCTKCAARRNCGLESEWVGYV